MLNLRGEDRTWGYEGHSMSKAMERESTRVFMKNGTQLVQGEMCKRWKESSVYT